MSTPVTFTVDFGPIIQLAVPVVVSALGMAGTAALGFLAQKFHLQVTAQQTANWDQALEKALNYGGMQAQALIAAHGYDHVEVQNAITAQALTYMVQKFPQAVKSQGFKLDLNDSENALNIKDALLRSLPAAMNKFAASPATPTVAK
jgi:hypothetical protein